VFGIYESDHHEFPRLLENDLNRHPGADFEVLNAGIPGMRVGSGTEYLKEIGLSLKPDVVVIYPTPTHYIGTTRPNCGRNDRKPSIPGAFEWPSSRLLAKSVDQAKAILPKSILTMARNEKIGRDIRGSAELQSVSEVSLAAMKYDLVCAVQQIKAIGAKPVLMTHANRFGSALSADDDYWLTGWRVQYPELVQGGFLPLERRANEIIKTVAEEEEIQLVDADAVLSGDRTSFADHAHFSDHGAERMAQLLADALTQERLEADTIVPGQRPTIVSVAAH
jgi:lysophospholipase L1-like esterase